MTTNTYAVVRGHDGGYQLQCTSEHPARKIATVNQVKDRTGGLLGWRLKPLVVMQGARSRIWPTPAEAIVSTKLMTPGQAKAAIRQADTSGSTQALVS